MMNVLWRRAAVLMRLPLIESNALSLQKRVVSEVVVLNNHLEVPSFKDIEVPPKRKDALLPVNSEELDDLAPELKPTFNLAAYANQSRILQEMIRLGVDLTRWEKRRDMCSFVLKMDFDSDVKQYIVFLHDVGVEANDLGRWLTLNPLILRESIEDLQTRCNYLTSKMFDQGQIARIVSRNPNWLLFSTVDIDNKLGFFQRTYKLSNSEVRHLATKQPRLITHKMFHIKRMNFAVLEEMGFTEDEMKSLLLAKPKLWMAHGVSLQRKFDYIHNVMGLTHTQILDFPNILTFREFILKQRHSYLKILGRDQYDCTKPNYVSPDTLVAGDDIEFCTNVAKATVMDFNNFLKTM